MNQGEYLYPYTEPCPYCARADLLKPMKRPRKRGEHFALPNKGMLWDAEINRQESSIGFTGLYQFADHRRVFLPADRFASRLRPFSVEMIGLEFELREARPTPPPPMLFAAVQNDWRTGTAKTPWAGSSVVFAALVIAHSSGLVLAVHWWPSHGRVMNLSGAMPIDREANAAIELAQTILEIFREETRGAPKITEAAIKGAVTKIIPPLKPTQAATAKVLEVSESALEKWRQRNGIKTWKEVVERLS
jgi:hypothetical protein